jgi:hypothetical protein
MSIHVTHLVNGPIGGPGSASQRWHRVFEHLADAMKATGVGFHEACDAATNRAADDPSRTQWRHLRCGHHRPGTVVRDHDGDLPAAGAIGL